MRSGEGITPWPDREAARYRALGYWEDRPLLSRFDQCVRDRPHHPAVIDGRNVLNYAALSERVDALSRGLLEHGLRSDDRLIVQLPNSANLVILLLACFRAGVIPVMALPAHREHELHYLAELSEARGIAVPARHRDFDHLALARRMRSTSASLECILVDAPAEDGEIPEPRLDELTAARASAEPVRPLPPPDPSSVACFLLSGGTTGLPKLIPRTHNDYAYNVAVTSQASGFDENTVYLGTLPLGHNFSLACPGVLGALSCGGTVVVLPSPEPERAFAAIARHGVTHAAAVPAVAKAWLDHAGVAGRDALRTLRILQVGGARLPDELAGRIEEELGPRLQQVFGMAEGLINMTRPDDPPEVIRKTQGRPVSEADELLVVDDQGLPVPAGYRGILLTRGPYTPRGYYRAPDHNNRAFTPDGWYVTGDVVVLRHDGNLVVEGRSKDLINRGGEKISAEEVENLAYRLPQVVLAAAVAYPDDRLGERVCLCLVQRDGAPLTLDAVTAAFEDWGVARYKWPERVEHLDDLPLTKVGKIDKQALRSFLSAQATGTGDTP